MYAVGTTKTWSKRRKISGNEGWQYLDVAP